MAKHRPTDSVTAPEPRDNSLSPGSNPAPGQGDSWEGDGRNAGDFDPAKMESTPLTNGATPNAAPDPFDPASLRLSQDFGATIGLKKALISVQVRKPDKSWFVRVHPHEAYRLPTAVIELKTDRGSETYLNRPTFTA
jgi:hypothetical protein